MSNPQWCAKHWQPVIDSHEGKRLPRVNGIALATMVMSSFATDPVVMGWIRKEYHLRQDDLVGADRMNNAVVRFSPLCCHLGDTMMNRLYKKCESPGTSADD